MKYAAWAFLLTLCPYAPAQAEPGAVALALEKSVQDAVEKAEPAVACVLVSRDKKYHQFAGGKPKGERPGELGGFPPYLASRENLPESPRELLHKGLDMTHPDYVPESYGSGVVVDRAGLILTCAHVVKGAVKVYVRLPGGEGSYADIHALDPRSDLAVLRLISPPDGLKPVTFGDGTPPRKGQFVVSLSNPFAAGFRDGSPSASWGVVSNLRRRVPGGSSEVDRRHLTFDKFAVLIQTDVRINLGCSGGALLNLSGQMIGLVSSRAGLTSVETPGGFALPIDQRIKDVVEVLKRGEEVEYGFLGVSFQPNVRGAVHLQRVIVNSPAYHAGLRDGDTLLAVDGVKVRSDEDVFLLINTRLAGSNVTLERERPRGFRKDEVKVTLGKYYLDSKGIASKLPRAPRGVRVEDACVWAQKNRFVTSIPKGVAVREVLANSPAEKARLGSDRLITRVNGKSVNTPEAFYRAMSEANGDVELTLSQGGSGSSQVTLKEE
jgi:serine protease Do